MTAVRQQIFDLLQTRMEDDDIGAAEIETMPSGDPAEFPALAIFDNGQSVAEAEAGSTRYTLEVTIEGYVERTADDGAHAQLNELHARVVAAVMTEPPLGGLAETIEEGPLRIDNAVLASLDRKGFAQDFTIQFATRRGDPSLPA